MWTVYDNGLCEHSFFNRNLTLAGVRIKESRGSVNKSCSVFFFLYSTFIYLFTRTARAAN